MELTSDLIALQGILSSLIKTTGEFTKINFRGGNEDKILDIIAAIHKFLSSQDGLKEIEGKKLNCRVHNKKLEDIVIFLALNTSFTHSLDLPEYSHLMNITPPLSKCLFINILCGLELNRYLCSVIDIFPVECSTELLSEMVPCLKKMAPKIHLDCAHMFLKSAASKLASLDFSPKVESEIDKLSDVTYEILRNLSGIYSDQIKDWKAAQIYQHMAYCLLDLFELLLYCDKSLQSLQKFIGNVITTCCSIVKNVTINVFCSWAEIREEDGSLQTMVSNKAYLVIEDCQKFPAASELVGMLSAIAKKPLTLTELIHMADVDMMIRKINMNDKDQKTWFKALLGMRKFNNEEVIKCLNCYYYLCNEDDVNLLLNCYVESSDPKLGILVKKSAATLTLTELIQVTTKHFYRNKFKNLTNDTEFSSALDKIKQDDDLEEELPKNIILFLLNSPEMALKYIYTHCFNNSFYTDCLRVTFSLIKEIAKIDNVGVTTLFYVLEENPLSILNSHNYVALFRTLIETEYFSEKIVALKIFDPLIRRSHEAKSIEELMCILDIVKQCDIEIPVENEFEDFIKLLLKIMNEYRCRFLKFDGSRQMVVEYIVDIFCDNICQSKLGSEVDLVVENEDCYTSYHRQYLTSFEEYSIFKHLCPVFDISDYGNCVHQMIQILPPCVSREWLVTAEEVIEVCGRNKCIELFTDVLILLSQVVETQNDESLVKALKHCLQNYGTTIQRVIYRNSKIEIEANVNKQVCRLLAKLPEVLKEEQGLLLINILTENSLKSLANDKEFLCHLILIKNLKICQVLAQKISQ